MTKNIVFLLFLWIFLCILSLYINRIYYVLSLIYEFWIIFQQTPVILCIFGIFCIIFIFHYLPIFQTKSSKNILLCIIFYVNFHIFFVNFSSVSWTTRKIVSCFVRFILFFVGLFETWDSNFWFYYIFYNYLKNCL